MTDVSANGRWVASGGSFGATVVSEVDAREPIWRKRQDSTVEAIALSPGGERVALMVGERFRAAVHVWDVRAKVRVAEFSPIAGGLNTFARGVD